MNKIAEFEITYKQYLNSLAEVVADLPDFASDHALLIDMYRMMNLCRIFDTKAVTLQRTGKLGTYAGIEGQEAISVTIGKTMHKDDVIAPAYREYGAYLQRGVKMEDILSFWGGDERGSDFASRKDFPICVPIATQCLHAAGAAFAFKYQNKPQVAVAVLGDGGTSKGDFYEAMNLAGIWKLPIVFVVNNNQWAISVPRYKQTATQTIAQKAIAAGIPSEQVDGNDIIALYESLTNALKAARENHQPFLIEAITYRLCDHTTADDAKRYREEKEYLCAKDEDPLIRTRKYLENINAWDENKETKLIKQCKEEVEQAVQNYLNREPQPATAMMDYLYAKLPKAYREQYELLEKRN